MIEQRGGQTLILDPSTSRFVRLWDIVMMIAMLFTATVTPWELAFVEQQACVVDELFVTGQACLLSPVPLG